MSNDGIRWRSAAELKKEGHAITKKTTNAPSLESLDLDNDEVTLTQDATTLGKLLSGIAESLRIVARKDDDEGATNSFILNAGSVNYMEAIIALFKSNPLQFSVETGMHEVPLENHPGVSLWPPQRTLTIRRQAQKRLKRAPILTLCYGFLCTAVIVFMGYLFFRIVI